jgi:hypothetical protein
VLPQCIAVDYLWLLTRSCYHDLTDTHLRLLPPGK